MADAETEATETVALDMTALEREHTTRLAEIIDHNDDLATRIRQRGVAVDYNEDLDILVVMFGTPTGEVWTESVGNRIGLHYEPETLKLVGVDILSARALLAEGIIAMCLFLHAVQATGAKLHTAPPVTAAEAPERLAADIRELVAV
jgi:hypothetical protein